MTRLPSPKTISPTLVPPTDTSSLDARLSQPLGILPSEEKADKKKAEKKVAKNQKQQVWQRTQSNTVLSKVSVGGKNYLILKQMRVTVSVEGVRARTVIDHIYYNPYEHTLQGTFKYTLPTGASVSYYAMFVGQQRTRAPRFFGDKTTPQMLSQLAPDQIAKRAPKEDWGKLREARLVAAEKGREVYEEITRQRIDPALLEQDAPNTFTGRVFPIPSKGYNRVIIAYEQTLPQIGDQLVYRFRFPNDVADAIDFSIEYEKQLATLSRSNLRKIRCRAPQDKAFLRCYWEQNKPDRDAVFYFKPKQKNIQIAAGTDPIEGKRYLYAKMRVDLPSSTAQYNADKAIFLLDTSLSANPDLFAAHVVLLKQILQKNQGRLRQFNVLFFDVGAMWASPKGWIENRPEERQALFQKLQRIVLEGATNFRAAMQLLAKPSWDVKRGTPVDIFVLSDGQINWGDTHLDAILAQFQKSHPYGQLRFFAYQMGLGSENATFAQRMARLGGAVFSCLGASEIPRCAKAHTQPAMLLEQVALEGIGSSELLVEGRQVSLYPGAFFAFAARYQRDGQAQLRLKGHYQGKPVTLRFSLPVKSVGDLAPRAWGEMAVSQLSELKDPKLVPLLVAYSQHFRIPNEHCSFLVLETDREYKQYGLEQQRQDQQANDLAQLLERWYKENAKTPDARQLWLQLIRKGAKRAHILRTEAGRSIFSMLRRTPDSDFLFDEAVPTKLWTRSNVPSPYLRTRMLDANDFGPFAKEAKRRLKRDISGAVRALSSIVEQNPRNPQALRLVAYYMMAWNQPHQAAPLFLRVLERRSFEPHSYRDLARALVKLHRYGLAAALYEIILSGRWHARFGDIHTIAREEYALLVHEALHHKDTQPTLRSVITRRSASLGLSLSPAQLRVTVTWNTDNTDIDLWVHEPNGEKCSYKHKHTNNGGTLLQDITRGYGPERYENRGGQSGTYSIKLHFYGHRSNVLGNETHASVLIVLYPGTSRQRIIEKHVVLKRRHQYAHVVNIKL